jgi:hypothetical protein
MWREAQGNDARKQVGGVQRELGVRCTTKHTLSHTPLRPSFCQTERDAFKRSEKSSGTVDGSAMARSVISTPSYLLLKRRTVGLHTYQLSPRVEALLELCCLIGMQSVKETSSVDRVPFPNVNQF